MSYYKVKSMNLRDWDNIRVTVASNNVRPIDYTNESYSGSVEDLFKDLLSGNLQFNPSNRQKVHEAYLQAKLYFRENKVDTYDLYDKGYNGDFHYECAFGIFKHNLRKEQNTTEYYIQINGNNFHAWRKYGYAYSHYGTVKKPFIDLLRAQLLYDEKVTFKEAE